MVLYAKRVRREWPLVVTALAKESEIASAGVVALLGPEAMSLLGCDSDREGLAKDAKDE